MLKQDVFVVHFVQSNIKDKILITFSYIFSFEMK